MAVEVVEDLELIDVQHDQAKRRLVAHGALPFAIEHFVEASPVGKTGEAILRRKGPELAIGRRELVLDLLAPRDIADRQDETGAVGHFTARCLDPDVGPAGMAGAKAEFIDLAGRQQKCHVLVENAAIARMHELDQRQRDQFLRLAPEQIAACR